METQSTSLYDRRGGIYPIATVLDDFIDRSMVGDTLKKNPRVDEAHHRVLSPGFKYLVAEMLAKAPVGPSGTRVARWKIHIEICLSRFSERRRMAMGLFPHPLRPRSRSACSPRSRSPRNVPVGGTEN